MDNAKDQANLIPLQRDNARKSYQLGLDSANTLYEMSASNLVEGFQQSQSNQLNALNQSINTLMSQFELTSGQAYSGWYADIIDQMSDLDFYTPDIMVGDGEDENIFEWNPFGVGVGNQESVGYGAYACGEGQHWDPTAADGEGDCVLNG